MAARVHPLFATRGPPGTHDLGLLHRLLDRLSGAGPGDRTPLPRFDKLADERVAALPGYRAHTLARAPAVAQHDFGPAGVFMGYDFHLGGDGPRLIEINTNAGGALLNASMFDANLVDEINLTISPMVTGDDSPRLSNGAPALHSDYQVAHILEDEGFLFIRYLRNR